MIRLTLPTLLCAALLTAPMNAQACAQMEQSWAALQTGDLEALQQASENSETAVDCSAIQRDQIDRWRALGIRMDVVAQADTLQNAVPGLEEALKVARPWQVTVALGDAARERRDFATAALHYQDAVADILLLSNPSSPYWDAPPSDDIAAQIKNRSDAARLLADEFVRPSGRPACQLQQVNSWFARTVAPITFQFGTATFTTKGTEAAEELFNCLSPLDPSDVTRIAIYGHTDPVGTDAYNMTLSKNRAIAVEKYLTDKGLNLPFEVVPKGEREPFLADDPDSYTLEDLHQMHRRVEVDVVK